MAETIPSSGMLSVEEARERVLARFQPLAAEEVALVEALGRVLAEDAIAREASPPFANSAMDGYALRASDTAGATDGSPVGLRLAGEVPAGSVYAGEAAPGEAVRILTGAPIPDGADAVIQQELVSVADGVVSLAAPVAVGNNIRAAGGDARPGTLLARAGTELGPPEIALLASLGVAPARVTRRPRVAILATGDELQPLGTPLRPGQIHDSNTPYLTAAVLRAGATPVTLGIARDREDDLRAKLDAAAGCDLLLTSGGVSVGDYDLVKRMLTESGSMAFWRVRVKPGKPLAFGERNGIPVLGLPGNPVSAAVTFELFGRPAIRRMLGAAQVERPVVEVVYEGRDLKRSDRREFVRVRLYSHAGRLVARDTGEQESHLISSLRGATALLIAPEGEGFMRSGETAHALLLNDALPWGVA
ncbi:MAG TPA: gephyrin-like molybdotransferase Glp [Ktedonobacterales bacterium]